MRVAVALALAGMAFSDVGPGTIRIRPQNLKLQKQVALEVSSNLFLSACGRFVACQSAATLTVFSASTGEKVCTIDLDHTGPIHDTAFAWDGSMFATLGNDGMVKIWGIPGAKKVGEFSTGTYCCSAVFTRDGRTLIADDGKRTGLILWNVAASREDKRIDQYGSSYTFVTPDGHFGVTSAGATNLIDLRSGALVKQIAQQSITRLVMSPDSKTFAGIANSMLTVWEASTGKELVSVPNLESPISFATYTPDGRYLVGLDATTTIHFLDARTLQLVHSIAVGGGVPTRKSPITFTRDGRMVVLVTGKVLFYR